MATVICKTEVKYAGRYYPAQQPFTINNNDLEEFQKLGAKILNVPKPVEKKEEKPHIPEPPVSPLASKTISQLVAFAKENGIDLGKATKKDDILKIIAESSDKGEEK